MATSNFYNQDGFDLWAADFSLPIYPMDDNGDEIPDADPIDYEFDEYAYNEAESKIDELNKQLKFYKLALRDGHYAGTQIEILDGEAPDEWYLNSPYFDFNEYGVNRYILRRMLQAERKKINQKLLPLFKEIGFNHYAISARFSNGETWYSKVA